MLKRLHGAHAPTAPHSSATTDSGQHGAHLGHLGHLAIDDATTQTQIGHAHHDGTDGFDDHGHSCSQIA